MRRRTVIAKGLLAGIAGTVALVYVARSRIAAMHGVAARSTMADARGYDMMATVIGPVYGLLARTAVAELGPGGSMLDVGCGPGQLVIQAARRTSDARITGADLDPLMIDRASANARHRLPPDESARVTFTVADVAALPFPDRSFDLVVSTFSMHHWSDPKAGLEEVYRVLKPGGRALIWDVAGPIRHLESAAPGPSASITGSPFRSLKGGRRWSLGPWTIAERYDLLRPAEAQNPTEPRSPLLR